MLGDEPDLPMATLTARSSASHVFPVFGAPPISPTAASPHSESTSQCALRAAWCSMAEAIWLMGSGGVSHGPSPTARR